MKKFLSLALAAVMALGVTFSFAGCDFGLGGGSGDDDKTNQGTQGGNNDQGNDQGNNDQEQGNKPQETPTVTDKTEQELFENLLKTEIDYLGVDGKLSGVNATFNGYATLKDATVDADAYLGVEDLTADIFITVSEQAVRSGGKLEDVDLFTMAFLRGEYGYTFSDEWDDLELKAGDWDPIMKGLKDGTYALGRETMQSDTSPEDVMAQVPMDLVTEFVASLPNLIGGGKLEAVPGGYTVSYDLAASFSTLAANLSQLLGRVEATTTVTELLKDPFLASVLKTLIGGIEAKTVLSLPMLPPDVEGIMPVAEDGQNLYDYLVAVAADKVFYSAFSSELPFEAECFGDLTVAEIFTLVSAMMPSGGEEADGPNYDNDEPQLPSQGEAGGQNGASGENQPALTSAAALAEEAPDFTETFDAMIAMAKGYLDTFARDFVNALVNTVFAAIEQTDLTLETKGSVTLSLNFGADKMFDGFGLSVSSFEANTSSDVPADKAYDVTGEADFTVTILESHTFTDLTGMHFTSHDPDRTKFEPKTDSYKSAIDPGELTFLEQKVTYIVDLTVTEKEIAVTLSVPDCAVSGAKVTLNVSTFPADKTPDMTGDGESIWGGVSSSKTTEVTFTCGGKTYKTNLVMRCSDEYDGVHISVALVDGQESERDVLLNEWYDIEFQRLSGVIA